MNRLILHYRDGEEKRFKWGALPERWEEPIYEMVGLGNDPSEALYYEKRIFHCRYKYDRFGLTFAHYYEDLPAKIEEAKADAGHGESSEETVEQSGPFMGRSHI